MSFSYNTNSPTSTTDKIRLLIGDTNEVDHLFEDEELTVFSTLADGEVLSAAALACRSIAIDTAKQAIAYRMLSDSVEIDKTKVPKYFMDLADKLESKLGTEPVHYIDSMEIGVNWAGIDISEYYEDEEIS